MKKILLLLLICMTLTGCGKNIETIPNDNIKEEISETNSKKEITKTVENVANDMKNKEVKNKEEQKTEQETIVYSENHFGNKMTPLDDKEWQEFYANFGEISFKMPFKWVSFTNAVYKGYTIPESEIVMLAPGECKTLTLESELYKTATFTLKNFADEEMPINKCGITRIEVDENINKDEIVTIAKGIYIGVEITEKELIDAYGKPDERIEQNSDNGDLCVNYIWYSDEYETSRHEILIQNNEVIKIIIDASGDNTLH